MANKEILINTKIDVDYKDAEKQLKKIDDKIKQVEHKRTVTFELQSNLEKQIRELETTLEAEKEKLSSMKIDLKLSKNSIAPSDVEKQTKLVSGLQSQYNKLQSTIFRQEDALDKCDAELKTLEADAAKYKSTISSAFASGTSAAKSNKKATKETADAQKDLESSAKSATKQLEKQGNTGAISLNKTRTETDRLSDSVRRFGDRLNGLVKRVFVFTLITSGLRKVRDWFGSILKTNAQMQSALANLKGAIYTLVTPLVNTVIPILVKIVNIITTIIYYIEVAITALTGFQFSSIVSDAQALYNATNGTADSLSDANDNAKDLKKTLASFDTLEILDKNEDTDTLDTGSLASSSTAPNWSFSKMLTDELDELAFYVSSALLLLGVVLLFSGASIPLGLGLIAVGALSLAGQIEANWDAVKELVETSAGQKLDIAGWGEICLGLLMIAAGMTKWGIGLIVSGVLALSLTEAIAPGTLKETMTGILKTPIEISELVAVAFGVLLICSGHIARGIGLLVYGLGTFALMEQWDPGGLKALVQTPLAGTIISITAYAALAFGVIALCCGRIAVGIALIAMGAVGIASMTAWNPNAIKELVQQPLVGMILSLVGWAMVALGVIMICCGRTLKGIAILVAGLVDLFATGTWNPDALKELAQKPLVGEIITAVGWALVALGVIMVCCGHVLKGLSVLCTGVLALYKNSSWNKDALKETVQGPLGIVLDITEYASIAIGLILICTGHVGVGITMIINGFTTGIFKETALNEDSSGFAQVASIVVSGITTAFLAKMGATAVKNIATTAFGKLFGDAAKTAGKTTVAEAVSDGVSTAVTVGGTSSAVSAAALGVVAFVASFFVSLAVIIGKQGDKINETTEEMVENLETRKENIEEYNAAVRDSFAETGVTLNDQADIAKYTEEQMSSFTINTANDLANFFADCADYSQVQMEDWNNILWLLAESSGLAGGEMAESWGYLQDTLSELGLTFEDETGKILDASGNVLAEMSQDFLDLIQAANDAGVKIPADLALQILSGKASIEEAAEQLGVSVPESVATGIANEDGKNKVDQAINNISGAVEEGVDTTASTIESKANETWDRIVAGSAEAGYKIPDEITKGIEDGTLSVEEACDLLLQYIDDGVSVTGTNIADIVGDTTDTIESETSETAEVVKKQHADVRKAIKADAEETEKTYKDTNKNIQTSTTETTDHINKKTKQTKQDIIDGSKEASNTMTEKLGSNSTTVKGINSGLESIGDTAENELGSNSTLTNAVENGESDSEDVWDSAADWETFLIDYTNEFEAVFGTTGTVVECARLGWAAILNMFTLGSMALDNALEPIRNSIRNAFDFTTDTSIQYGIKNYMYNLQVTIVSYLNAIISSVESGIFSITNGLNSLITSMNSVVRQAQNLQYKRYTYGSYLYGSYLSRISYPRYAAGTVVPPNSAHLAVIGDNTKEPEVVSPVSTMKQAFIEAMQEMGGMNGGNVNVYLDGKQISNAVSKWQGRTNRAYGL